MARMEVEYTLQEENDVGVENFKFGKMFVQFNFADPMDITVDKLNRSLDRICNLNKHEVLGLSFVAKYDEVIIAEGSLYAEGEGRWITPVSETIH
jgi:hypothetical protein